MLRKSGLTKLEQRQVLASAGAVWDLRTIEDSLKLVYGDAHLEDKWRAGGIADAGFRLKSKGGFEGKQTFQMFQKLRGKRCRFK